MSAVAGWLMPERLLSGGALTWVLGTLALAALLQAVGKVAMLFVKRSRALKALKDFPGPPPHWLYGNLKDITLDDAGMASMVRMATTYGPAIRMHFVMKLLTRIVLTKPDFLKVLLPLAEPKDPVVYRFVEPWIGDGLLVSKGKKWARNRRLLTPAFHFDILKPYVGIFSASANVMAEKWRGLLKTTDSLDMFEHVSLMTLDSLLKCIFGMTDGNVQLEGRRNPYIQAVYDLTELTTKRFRFFPYHNDWIYYFSPSGYRFRKCCNVVHTFSKGVIRKRTEEKQREEKHGIKTTKKYLDFLDMLLDAKDSDGKGLTDQEIQHEVDTFMFEGHDTTASGLSWCLYNLATHPQYQQRCREEVMEVMGDRQELTWEDMSRLPYLTMCIKESLRTHPPVPNVGRMTTKPLTFPDGRTVPAGTWMGIAIYACHHNPDVWPDPEVYDPERFSPENSKDRSPHAFIPFSAGPRNCIGQHFAMHEMKTVMAICLRNFEFTVDESKPILKLPELILRSKGGLWLKPKEIPPSK